MNTNSIGARLEGYLGKDILVEITSLDKDGHHYDFKG